MAAVDLRVSGSAPWSQQAVRLLVGITLAGLALRLGWLLIAQPAAVSDALGYKTLAQRWFSDGLYERFGEPTAWRTPGYIGFLGVGTLVSDSDVWLGALERGGRRDDRAAGGGARRDDSDCRCARRSSRRRSRR